MSPSVGLCNLVRQSAVVNCVAFHDGVHDSLKNPGVAWTWFRESFVECDVQRCALYHGEAWCGVTCRASDVVWWMWCGVSWCVVWCDLLFCDLVSCVAVRCDVVWFDVIYGCVVWFVGGGVWCDCVWCGVTWYMVYSMVSCDLCWLGLYAVMCCHVMWCGMAWWQIVGTSGRKSERKAQRVWG